MSTDLGTKNAAIAKQRVSEVVRMREKQGRSSVASPTQIQSSALGSSGISTDVGVISPGDPLGDWYAGDSEFVGSGKLSGDGSTPKAGPTNNSGPVVSTQSVTAVAPIIWESDKPLLTAEEKKRTHDLLAGVVTKCNVLVLGAGVRIFGRVAAEPSEKDTELLSKAWSLQLDIILANKELQPAILIVAASVGLGIGMWAQGEPLPPKVQEVNIDGSKAK